MGNTSGSVQVASNTTHDGHVDRLHQYLLDQVIPTEPNNESNEESIDILVLIGTSIAIPSIHADHICYVSVWKRRNKMRPSKSQLATCILST